MILPLAFVCWALLLCSSIQLSEAKLLTLISLSRHGSRAPNKVVKIICPNNDPNLNEYNVPPQQLTENGMRQLKSLGQHIRQVYVEEKSFLSAHFWDQHTTSFETYFRADSAERCGQSASSMALGLYPNGTGPASFPEQPVPVYMQLLQNERDFAATKNVCKKTLEKDLDEYAETRAKDLFKRHADVINSVTSKCGVSFESMPQIKGGEDQVLAIKDINDAFIFDTQQGLSNILNVSSDHLSELESVAFTMLMERYYSTARQVTYWSGGFPHLIMDNLRNSITPDTKKYSYFSYHGHRELLHAMGVMLSWDLVFPNQPFALNHTSLPPATTMFFELHSNNESITTSSKLEDYHVQTFMWSPHTGREQVTLRKCATNGPNCPLSTFFAIMNDHIRQTGTYEDICMKKETIDTSRNFFHYPVLLLVGTLLLVGYFVFLNTRRRKRDYTPLISEKA